MSRCWVMSKSCSKLVLLSQIKSHDSFLNLDTMYSLKYEASYWDLCSNWIPFITSEIKSCSHGWYLSIAGPTLREANVGYCDFHCRACWLAAESGSMISSSDADLIVDSLVDVHTGSRLRGSKCFMIFFDMHWEEEHFSFLPDMTVCGLNALL